ncbi:MAG: hypothetical protein CMG74_07590 [Candidatus Marinimicrobia bacterium]|nr:hypothetical protein [Candidatus Neomarinimicrobiota bacterium]|tara:strand:+ start:2070 stop:2966 length:897 start_codon:yes stop_codon:yes gene_type:complete
MLTIFTTPKDFDEEFDIIQRNALCSWRAVSNDLEIIILGDSLGAEEAATSINAKYIANVEKSVKGTPTISGMFTAVEKYAKNNLLCYVNADIVLPKNIMNISSILSEQIKKFMAVGYRWDLDVSELINFNDDQVSRKFWNNARKQAIKHPSTGIDYFIFKKYTFKNILELAVGRLAWDNWLLWKTRRMRLPLIDVSNELFVIHQNHGYNHMGFKGRKDMLIDHEVLSNRSLVKNQTLNLLDANWVMEDTKIKKKLSMDFKDRNLDSLQKIYPEFKIIIKIYKKIKRKFRVLTQFFSNK